MKPKDIQNLINHDPEAFSRIGKAILRLLNDEKPRKLDRERALVQVQSKWVRRVRYDFLPGFGYIVGIYFNLLTTSGPMNPGGKRPTYWVLADLWAETGSTVPIQKELESFLNVFSFGKKYVDDLSIKPNTSGHGGHNTGEIWCPMNWNELEYALEKYKHSVNDLHLQMELHQFAFSGENQLRLRDQKGLLIQKANHIKNKERKYTKIYLAKTKENFANAYSDFNKGKTKVRKVARTTIGMAVRPVKTSKRIVAKKTKSITQTKLLTPTRQAVKKGVVPKISPVITKKIVPITSDLVEFVEMVTKFQKIANNPTYLRAWVKRSSKAEIRKRVQQFLREMTKYKKQSK